MPARSSLVVLAASFFAAVAPLPADAACPDAAGDCVVEGETVSLGGRQHFDEVLVGAGGRIVVPRFDGTDKQNTGNLELIARRIAVAEGGAIMADGRGYQPLLCQNGRGPFPDSGGRGGCAVQDSGGGGAHFGGGGRGTKDCFIVAPAQSCQFPAEWEEDCGYKRANRNRCRSRNGCYNNDALPSVAGAAYRHSIYEVEMGAAGGDKGCRDAWDNVSTGGAGGGRIVLAGLAEDGSGEVSVLGRVSADGWRGCGHGNDSAGGGAGGTVLVLGDRVHIGPAARVSAEGGIGGDTQDLPYKDQACPAQAQSGGTCDDCGGGGGGGVVSVLSGQPTQIDPAAELDVSGAIGGSCNICNGEAGGGAGELQLAGAYLGEICDGWDNDFDGETDEDLGTVSCGWGSCKKTVPACDQASGRPLACVPDVHPDCTEAAGDNRPRILVVVDTSASMLLDVDGLPTFGDGSAEHPHLGGPSRLLLAKDALTAVLSAFPEIDYSLARFAQHAGSARSCLRASCGKLLPAFL